MARHSANHQVRHASHAKRDTLPSEQATFLIQELAERQHGVVARRQLLELGLGRGLICDRVRGGRLIRLHRGVFALGHRRIGLRGEWIAAVLAAGPAAVLSHGSAAHLWELRGSRGAIEVARPSGGVGVSGIRTRQARLLPQDVTVQAGIPVTTVERTLADIAARLGERQLEHAVVAADRAGRLRWPRMVETLERSSGRVGIARLRKVVAVTDPRAVEARSPLEVDFLALCREAGLPAPQVNVLVEGRLVDFLWVGERVIVETDGYSYHRDRAAFERDHESTLALETAGYVVRRATYRMLRQDPGRFMAEVRRSVERSASRIARYTGQK
jgi:predicted transcriptional regulator of viral defense system